MNARITTILDANPDFEFKLNRTASTDPDLRWYAELYDFVDEVVHGHGYGSTPESAMASMLDDHDEG